MDKANLPQEAVTASLKKTQDHIVRVRVLIGQMMKQLAQRALHHDASKLQEVEAIPLAVLEAVSMEHGPAQFGTPEYEERKQILGAMLEHHYAHNSHHPEHESAAKEEWRPVAGYEGLYDVSNLGRVRTVARVVPRDGGRGSLTVHEVIRKGTLTPKGYARVQLSKDGRPKNHMVHVLVAEAFLGPKPSDDHEVNHKFGVKHDNRAWHLEWSTQSENMQHAYDHGLKTPAVKYLFFCEELSLATLGAEKMAEECRAAGHEAVIAAGVYGAAMRDGSHHGLGFTAVEVPETPLYDAVAGMDLFDLFEMFVDWKAASEGGGEDSMRLDVACIRYEVSPQLRDILCNTADRLGWRRD